MHFTQALADDLNISVSLASLFEMVRDIHALCDANRVSHTEAQSVIDFLKNLNTVLGVLHFEKEEEEIPEELQEALRQRIQARQDKNWALADQLRDLITTRGYLIEDTATGMRLKKQLKGT
jgi:cysteinyl-tRNA synthetase